MTKKEFEAALKRSVEALMDGGQPGIDDVLLIDKAIGRVGLLLSRKVSVSAHGVEKKSTGGVYEEQQVSALLK